MVSNFYLPTTPIEISLLDGVECPKIIKPGSSGYIASCQLYIKRGIDSKQNTLLAYHVVWNRFGKTGKKRADLVPLHVPLVSEKQILVGNTTPSSVYEMSPHSFLCWAQANAMFLSEMNKKNPFSIIDALRMQDNTSFSTLINASYRYSKDPEYCLASYTTDDYRHSFLVKMQKIALYLTAARSHYIMKIKSHLDSALKLQQNNIISPEKEV